MSAFAEWDSFYVIVGSSAGALTGLQFVVITLIAEAQAAKSIVEIRAFGTPTVVHFCASLLISVILSAPWTSLSGPAIGLGCSLALYCDFVYAGKSAQFQLPFVNLALVRNLEAAICFHCVSDTRAHPSCSYW